MVKDWRRRDTTVEEAAFVEQQAAVEVVQIPDCGVWRRYVSNQCQSGSL